jgi:hypothetical protein
MNVIKNLINSEKAVTIGLLVIAATVLTALGDMSVAEWREYTTWMAGFYVTGKTIQSAADSFASARVEVAEHQAKGLGLDGDVLGKITQWIEAATRSVDEDPPEPPVVVAAGTVPPTPPSP